MIFRITKLKKICNSELTLFCNSVKKHTGIRWSSKYFVTVPIFYVNADPHIGHLYTAVIGDAAVRFHRLKNPHSEVKFMVGTDEHGLKISQSASKLNTDVKLFCDKVSQKYRDLFNLYSVEADDFVRTTEERHFRAATFFWKDIFNKGYIYKDEYSGWYCVQDETFVPEIWLDPNLSEDGFRFTVQEKKKVEFVKEVNYKFKLSKFKNDLLHWLKSGDIVKPKIFQDILQMYIEKDEIMQDISVSRPAKRVSWGIPVPDDPSQTMYVWLDALSSYLSANGYPDSSFKWPPDLQIVGKDILKFHGVYWPAFLIAAGLEPPKCIHCHSHWIKDGEKMSKSKGNIVNPFDSAKKYTSDGFRYFLLSKGVPHTDGNFSEFKINNYLNSELGDSLGNLLSRCTGKSINSNQVFPIFSDDIYVEYRQNYNGNNLINSLKELPDLVEDSYENFNFYRGIEKIVKTLHLTNKFFAEEEPWTLRKDPKEKDHLNYVLSLTMESLRVCGILLQPICPNISNNLLNKLSIPKDQRNFCDVKSPLGESAETSNSFMLMKEDIILFPKLKL